MMIKGILDLFAPEVVKTIGGVIDELTTTEEEKGRLKLQFLNQQLEAVRESNKLEIARIEAQTKQIEAQTRVIEAEVKSDSWLAKTWRPIVMLMFAGIAVGYAFGYVSVPQEFVDELFTLLTVGIGGYTVCQTSENITTSVIKNKQRGNKRTRKEDKIS